jgi:hypothetical protein
MKYAITFKLNKTFKFIYLLILKYKIDSKEMLELEKLRNIG